MPAPGTAAWYERAALQGVPRDEAKAREWFTLVAAGGSSLADEALAGLE